MIAALLLLALQQPQLDFRFQPEIGDRLKGLVSWTFLDAEDDARIEIKERFEVEMAQGGSTSMAKVLTLLDEVLLDGEKMPFDREEKGDPFKLWLGGRGQYLNLTNAPMDETAMRRLFRLIALPMPEKPLDFKGSWVHEYPAIESQRLPPATFRATMTDFAMGRDERKQVILDVAFEEKYDKGLRGRGTVTVDLLTGWPMKVVWKASNAVAPGSEGQLSHLDLVWEVGELTLAKRG